MKMKAMRMAVSAMLILAAAAVAAETDAQKSFDKVKQLAGTWEGKGSNGQPVRVSYRVISGGSAVLSEIGEQDMITMFHMDGNRLLMTHYCGSGNQPRMQATASPDGKTIAFEFVDATNLASPQGGHMHRMVLTIADVDHHSEEWDWFQDGKIAEHMVFDLQRKK
jgi:hypothetical protein